MVPMVVQQMWSSFIPLEKIVDALLKMFHDEEEDDIYKKSIHLKQKGFVSEYTHEWEVLVVRQRWFSNEELLKMYRCGLKCWRM